MSCYISSNNERAFVALENEFGEVGAVTGAHRIPLVKLDVRQTLRDPGRRDKTGSRTFAGLPNKVRTDLTFRLNTLMMAWGNAPGAPAHGALFQAAMGGEARVFAGGTVAGVPSLTQITFGAAHGLSVGQGITFGGEMRFVTGVPNATTVIMNAAFSEVMTVGAVIGPTVTYRLATDLKSASIHDRWDPAEAVQRIVSGAAMDVMRIRVNGDFHEFEFSGPAKNVVDSATFVTGDAGLVSFPEEPASVGYDATLVPGHLGQVWMGSAPSRMHTLTSAELVLDNGVSLRSQEFGSDAARCIAAGQRSVKLNFRVYPEDEGETVELYQAARQRSPVEVMLQLGEEAGQLFGAYLPALVPELPEFGDAEARLEWNFDGSRAQGAVDDELYVCFG